MFKTPPKTLNLNDIIKDSEKLSNTMSEQTGVKNLNKQNSAKNMKNPKKIKNVDIYESGISWKF